MTMRAQISRTATLAVILVALSACGRVGTLEQPAPLYGAKAKADYLSKKAAEASAATRRDEGGPETIVSPSSAVGTLPAGAVPPPAADQPKKDRPGSNPE